MIPIKNGRVIDPVTDDVMDMVIDGGKIAPWAITRKKWRVRNGHRCQRSYGGPGTHRRPRSFPRSWPYYRGRISGPERQRRKREASPRW